jgi:hypothetical protein
MNASLLRWSGLLLYAGAVAPVLAATYTVGPGGQYPTLNAAFQAVDLGPGDVVEVMGGGPAYAGGVIVPEEDGGAPGNPVILRGVGPSRPHLSGGTNTIEFRLSDHLVFENFEVSGTGDTLTGTFRCVYHHAHDIVVRNVYIHDCPRHGILGADTDSGSLTVEYSEIYNAGSNTGNHAIYMATDEVAHPGSVFRLQYSYVRDSRFDDTRDGGNLIKSRAERNEIYYNWLEGAFFHELELIGPDPAGAHEDWNDDLAREDSDVVGNVIVHTSDFGSVLRFGGDGTSGGRGETFGRYRVVNNTILRRNTSGNTTIFRLFEGIDALEFHNNVIWREGSGTLTLVRAVEAQWVGSPKVTGSNNWISSGFVFNPTDLPHSITGSVTGTLPGFASLAGNDLSPDTGSPLLDAGNAGPASPAGFEIAAPLFPPQREPPARVAIVPGGAALRLPNGTIDIGAYEQVDLGLIFYDGFED